MTARASGILGRLAVVAASAAAARGTYALLGDQPPGGAARWTRTNHRGDPVTLLEGPAAAVGCLVGVAASAALPGRLRAASAVAVTGAAVFGAVDDHAESGASKGLRGHLTALAHGRVTTGGLKVLGIGVTGLAAAVLMTKPAGSGPAGSGHSRAGAGVGRICDVGVAGGLVAGTANLINLFDLRPGRALKVCSLAAPVAAASAGPAAALAAAALGPVVGLLAEDLSEAAMLGDTGANALGALLGTAMAAGLPRRARIGALVGVVALTLASEKVSFTKVIESTPVLRAVDALGRRPR